MLKDRVQRFLMDLGIPITQFGKRVDLSYSALNKWLKGELALSEETERRIDNYIRKFNY